MLEDPASRAWAKMRVHRKKTLLIYSWRTSHPFRITTLCKFTWICRLHHDCHLFTAQKTHLFCNSTVKLRTCMDHYRPLPQFSSCLDILLLPDFARESIITQHLTFRHFHNIQWGPIDGYRTLHATDTFSFSSSIGEIPRGDL